MDIKYRCSKCGTIYPADFIKKEGPYCKLDGTFLRIITRQDGTLLNPNSERPPKILINKYDFNIDALYHKFSEARNIEAYEGMVWQTTLDWIIARKEAYIEYQDKFKIDNLFDEKVLTDNFRSWLSFKNNKSWTTYERPTGPALQNPKGLAKLLSMLQKEDLTIDDRVNRGLEGDEKVIGIDKGILTSLLHTLYPDKYGVWNTVSENTLKLFQLFPEKTNNRGQWYVKINAKLLELANRLKTDLTTIDGFMWYVNAFVEEENG